MQHQTDQPGRQHPEGSHELKIAGITVQDLGDEPPYTTPGGPGFIEGRERIYARSLRAYETPSTIYRGAYDNRIESLHVDDGSTTMRHKPAFNFLLNGQFLDVMRTATEAKGAPLTQNDLLRLGLEAGEDAVSPHFEPDALNAVNASYYASPVAFSPEAGLATMFVENRPINTALGAMLSDRTQAEHIRVKELCSGGNTDHWRIMAAGAAQNGTAAMDIVLSDFVQPAVDTNTLPTGMTITSESYSLLNDMPELPPEERLDAIIATYGFDSVWQPEDMRLERIGGVWHQMLYRVKVADWNPRRQELIEAMRHHQPLPDAEAADYDGIFVETAYEPIDITDHPLARHIEDHAQKRVNVPGGLIKRVVDAFASQLNENGVFVSADVTGDNKIGVSGIAARYKFEDYQLAKNILEQEHGLHVDLLSLPDLTERYLVPGWEQTATAQEFKQIDKNPVTQVLVVSRS